VERLVGRALEAVGWDFPPMAAQAYCRYLEELQLWNRKVGLVKAESTADLVSRHLYDSLSPLPLLEKEGLIPVPGSAAVDIGSGGGFPGIPLALALPGLSFTLVERSGRKAGFLVNAVALLGIAARVDVLQEDASLLPPLWDLALCRAFMPLSEALPILLGRLKPGGTLVVYGGKASLVEQELSRYSEKSGPGIMERVQILKVESAAEFDSGERNLVIFRK
jgi:16S rRNA (guanine527-N7)-methyltransferase